MRGEAHVAIVGVLHEIDDGWHKFTSPQVPGLYIVVESRNLRTVYEDLPTAIAELIEAATHKKVVVRLEKTYDQFIKSLPETERQDVLHYSVEPLAA